MFFTKNKTSLHNKRPHNFIIFTMAYFNNPAFEKKHAQPTVKNVFLRASNMTLFEQGEIKQTKGEFANYLTNINF